MTYANGVPFGVLKLGRSITAMTEGEEHEWSDHLSLLRWSIEIENRFPEEAQSPRTRLPRRGARKRDRTVSAAQTSVSAGMQTRKARAIALTIGRQSVLAAHPIRPPRQAPVCSGRPTPDAVELRRRSGRMGKRATGRLLCGRRQQALRARWASPNGTAGARSARIALSFRTLRQAQGSLRE
jgi:hypothetical protein